MARRKKVGHLVGGERDSVNKTIDPREHCVGKRSSRDQRKLTEESSLIVLREKGETCGGTGRAPNPTPNISP